MRISVESRIHRTIVGAPAFKRTAAWEALNYPDTIASPLKDQEKLLGVYENTPDSPADAVVFTNFGIYCWKAERWRQIRYIDIAKTLWPTEGKQDPRALPILMKDGSCEELPLRKGWLFAVMRFFNRVIEDLSANSM